MGVEIDRHGHELTALLKAADFRGTRILEVGCGDGRLARRYAHLSPAIVGLDTDMERLAAAAFSSTAMASLHFVRGASVPLPFRDDAFGMVLFGWSL